jgi:hypothetical protein
MTRFLLGGNTTMTSSFRLVLAFCLTTCSTSLFLAGQTLSVHHYSGEEWLSWNGSERDIYVRGYIDGNGWGTSSVCRTADDLFETNQGRHPGDETHPSDFPSARCLAKRPTYSKAGHDPGDLTGLSAYTGVITEFYTKHPEYRRVPFDYLMMQLNDKDFKTADQLFEMAKRGAMNAVFVY